MNILMVSRDLSGGDLCVRLQREGHSVRVFVYEKSQRNKLRGIVRKTKDWRKELKWAGKDGLILFDSTGFGKIQDELRKEGYSVVGGSEKGDHCEDDRAYGQKVLWASGVKVASSRDFHSLDEAIHFVKKHPDEWVIKQNGHASKIFNYVGQLASGEDVISTLESYKKRANKKKDVGYIELQKRIRGIEIGVGRYFNGSDWVGPIEMNIEHKDLYAGNVGPKTYEMGTLMWFDDNEENRLFQETLGRLKDYLKHIHFHGDVDINCIVNEQGVFPLELTARFGFPALQLQCALSTSPWGDFLKAVALGQSYDFKYRKGYGVTVLVAIPPFPYLIPSKKNTPQNLDIFFKGVLMEEEENRIHFEEVSRRKDGTYYVSSEGGFVLHVSGTGKTVEAARQQAYALIDKIVIPKMFYRTDIGVKFAKEDRKKLKEWGYV